MKESREVLTIQVEITGATEVKGKTGEALMIYFGGSVDCELFKGRILPGGVDTQKEWYGEARTLSARYTLEGADCSGKPCHIFIENNGVSEGDKGITKTVPRIITDSDALAFLETAKLTGTISPAEKGVTIHIFQEQ
jgi:hypothetical protein